MQIDSVTTAVVQANFDYTYVRVTAERRHLWHGRVLQCPCPPADSPGSSGSS